MTSINNNNNGSTITWNPTSKEIKPSSVWANMPSEGLDRYIAPGLSEIRDIAKLSGNPKRISREDIEAYRHQTPMSEEKAGLLMEGYRRAASSEFNGLKVVGKHIGNGARFVAQFIGGLFGYVPESG